MNDYPHGNGTSHCRFFHHRHLTSLSFRPQTNVGSILISVNSYTELGNALTLNSTRTKETSAQLKRVVREAVRQQSETGYPQGIILSGGDACGQGGDLVGKCVVGAGAGVDVCCR